MASPQSSTPPNPTVVLSDPIISAVPQLVAGVTLTAPTSATLITGLTYQVTVPNQCRYLAVFFNGTNATVTAAATITTSLFTGATSGALTTQLNSSVVVAPTGGTTVAANSIFWVPIVPSQWGTSFFLSIAATASTGNYVLNASATSPATMAVMAY